MPGINNNYSLSNNYKNQILIAYNGNSTPVDTGNALGVFNDNGSPDNTKAIDTKIVTICGEIDSRLSQVSSEGNWITSNYEDSAGYQAVISGNGKIRFYRGNSIESVKNEIRMYLNADFSDVPVDSIRMIKLESMDTTLETKHGYAPYVPENIGEIDTILSEYSYAKLFNYKSLYDAAETFYGGVDKANKDSLVQARSKYEQMIIPKFEGSKYYDKAKARINEINKLLEDIAKMEEAKRQEEARKQELAKKQVVIVPKPEIKPTPKVIAPSIEENYAEADNLLDLLRQKFHREQDYDGATNIANKIKKLCPGRNKYNLWADTYLGRIAYEKGDYRNAIQILSTPYVKAKELLGEVKGDELIRELTEIKETADLFIAESARKLKD